MLGILTIDVENDKQVKLSCILPTAVYLTSDLNLVFLVAYSLLKRVHT